MSELEDYKTKPYTGKEMLEKIEKYRKRRVESLNDAAWCDMMISLGEEILKEKELSEKGE